jgi:alpha-tubulin suppressor-like RCC1 family protein
MKSKVLKLALGETHSCALCLGGRVRCWGDNTTGQLGLGHTLFQADRHPYQTLDASGHPGMVDLGGVAAIDVSAGYGFTCALLTGGNIRCWGANDTGQLGLGNTTPTPTRIAAAIDLGSGLTATAVSAGYGYACALLSDGTVRCWGDNSLGLLGVGNAQPVLAGTVALGTGVTAIAVAAGGAQACALLSGGAIHCWGDNYFGEFGLGTSTPMDSTTALPSSYGDAILKAGLIATSISLGSSSNCAILSDDELECWGANNVGQLGLGYTTPLGATETPSVPAIVPTGSPAVAQVATGAAHACALYSENAGIRCWGANQKGQLGYGDTKRRGETTDTIPANLAPIQLPSGLTAVAVYAGPGHTCALLSDASFRCWGWNDHGQLGLGVISGIEVGTPDSIGGASTETPDQLPPVQIFPPQEIQ